MHHTLDYLSYSTKRSSESRASTHFPIFNDVSKASSTDYLVPSAYAAGIHGFSAAAAGGIATMVTHPFDVIKVLKQQRMST